MENKTRLVILGLITIASIGCTFGLIIEVNEISDIDLFNKAAKLNIHEANSCAELQWEDFKESRNCLLRMIEKD